MRADLYLFEKGSAKSRENAKRMIEEGLVSIDRKTVTKPSQPIDETAEHEVFVTQKCPYVSRGGMKLEGALHAFSLDVSGKICLDVGASTGGFTDCLLQSGASRVYAVDVGERQLDPKLARDSRVISTEHCNARYLSKKDFDGMAFDVIVMDVSFISATLILPTFAELLQENGFAVILVKPQFEAGKQSLGKNGIVKDPKAHISAIEKVIASAAENGLSPVGLLSSPILGGDGNREFLLVLTARKTPSADYSDGIKRAVLGQETVIWERSEKNAQNCTDNEL